MTNPGSAETAEDRVTRRIAEAAERARSEAEQRRRAKPAPDQPAREVNGRNGPDPVRYGDWEVKGVATDF
jgi:hypothetical protein